MFQVKKIHEKAVVPKRANPGDAGFDLRAIGNWTIPPGQMAMIPIGLAIALPRGYVGLVCPRSGLSAKYGITITNAPGIIDSEYRGEIKVILHNNGSEDFLIDEGDRIAQLVVVLYLDMDPVEVSTLDETERGQGGFGSTGQK